MSYKEIEKMSLHELLEYTGGILDKSGEGEAAHKICFNHPLERYLYEYWNDCSSDSYEIMSEPLGAALKLEGEKYMSTGQYESATEAYGQACNAAPADVEAAFGKAGACRAQGRWEQMRECMKNAYGYIFSRTDIAQYYRYMGCYELEMYHPDTALALYRYSNLFSHSDTADSEIDFLKKAGTDMREMDSGELKNVIKKTDIPLQPDPASIGLAYRVGRLALENGSREYGMTLIKCVYELTGDSEAGELLRG